VRGAADARHRARHQPLYRPRRKVLVLDLDNTLWGGIVSEVGSERDPWRRLAARLCRVSARRSRARGERRILALNSKNNEADARAVLTRARR
jgi:predicted enzyme involved in methoxymalonyl-ACP biosynthesis